MLSYHTASPEWIVYLHNRLFEELPIIENDRFAVDFLKYLPVGVNLNIIKHKFCSFVLKDCINTMEKLQDVQNVIDSLKSLLVLHENTIKTGIFNQDSADKVEFAVQKEVEKSIRRVVDAASWAARFSRASEITVNAIGKMVTAAAHVSSATVDPLEGAKVREEKYKIYANELIRLLIEINNIK